MTRSSLKCFKCNTNFSKHLANAFTIVHYAKCMNCGQANNGNNIEVDILPTSLKLQDLEYSLQSTWWHGTVFGGWGEWIGSPLHPNTANVHVGTYPAAIHRRSAFTRTHDWHMFQVRIKEGVDMHGIIERDAEDNQITAQPGIAQRYVNVWESPGSISLVVNRHDIEVVSTKVLTRSSDSARVAA